jgi:hypothetical protein
MSLATLPLKGLLLVLILSVPYLLRWSYVLNRPVPYLLAVLGVLLIMGAVTAFVAPYVVDGDGPATLRYLLGALVVMLLFTVVTFRYLVLDVKWAAITGFIFSMLSVLAWYSFDGLSSSTIDLIGLLFAPLLVVLGGVLALHVYMVHIVPGRTVEEGPLGGATMGLAAKALFFAFLLYLALILTMMT